VLSKNILTHRPGQKMDRKILGRTLIIVVGKVARGKHNLTMKPLMSTGPIKTEC